jgi:hypothetical protein
LNAKFLTPKNPGSRAGRWAVLFSSLLLPLILLTGCARHLTDANLACVKMDMSPKEVESILGPPTRQESGEIPLQEDAKTLPLQRYYYDQEGKTVEIHFVDGKLVAWEGSFDK